MNKKRPAAVRVPMDARRIWCRSARHKYVDNTLGISRVRPQHVT